MKEPSMPANFAIGLGMAALWLGLVAASPLFVAVGLALGTAERVPARG